MFTRKKAAAFMGVICALPMFAPGAGQNGSKEVKATSGNSSISSLDYSVQTATERVYQLKWNAGAGGGSLWCKMEVTIDKHKRDPNDKNPRADLLDLAISYSGFGYAFPKPAEKTALDSRVHEARFDRFAYTAVIDKYGQLVSSDLAREIAPLQKSAGEAEQTVMSTLLQPAIFCTWVCVFPKLGPFERGERAKRDIRDWTPLGVPDIVNALGHTDTADKFHVVDRGGNKMILWSKTMRQETCAKYFGTDNISATTKIEITYSRDLKGVEKASWERATSFEKRPQDDTSATFEAILQDK
jgi:hypothetical protein